VAALTLLATSAFAQDAATDANHQLLADLNGTWDCKVSFWMTPGGPPLESTGTSVRKPVMDGHYFIMDTVAKMQMPGPDGKMQLMDYKGMEMDGYDNMKGKFFSTWIDSMGTGVLISEGSYDPASKTFTYHMEEEMAPGKTMKIRETLQVIDKDHNVMEWYEDRADKQVKMMEITYTRQK
jgi:hypothetical protein